MIIEPRIHMTAEEMEELKRNSTSIESAIQLVRRVQHALRTNSFNVVQFATDPKTNEEGELVDAGPIAIRTDAEGNEL